jgi:hypothetical protein
MSRTKESVCCGCGSKLDAASTADGSDYTPEPGSLSICAYCGVVSIFEDDMSLKPMTLKEIDDLPFKIRSEVMKMSNFIKQKNYSIN